MRRLMSVLVFLALAGCLTPAPDLVSTAIDWSGTVTYPVCGPQGEQCQGGSSATHVLDYQGEAAEASVTVTPERGPTEAEIRVEIGRVRDCGPDCRRFTAISSDQDTGTVEVEVEDLQLGADEDLGVRVVPPSQATASGQERSFNATGFVFAWVESG